MTKVKLCTFYKSHTASSLFAQNVYRLDHKQDKLNLCFVVDNRNHKLKIKCKHQHYKKVSKQLIITYIYLFMHVILFSFFFVKSHENLAFWEKFFCIFFFYLCNWHAILNFGRIRAYGSHNLNICDTAEKKSQNSIWFFCCRQQ